MPVVFACIAPHGGHLLLDQNAATPVPKSRAAMAEMRRLFEASQPDCIALLTPHGVGVGGAISLGIAPRAAGEVDGVRVDVPIDSELAAAWAYQAVEMGVPVTPITTQTQQEPFPLDWGAVIPLALLTPETKLPLVVGCPSRELTDAQLIAWGEALVFAADTLGRRVALVASADQGHGHAADGPYGYHAESAAHDQIMIEAVQSDNLPRLLAQPSGWAESALADSYWQTLAIIGVQKHVPLKAHFLSYEIDHYFGLLCAAFV